AVAELRRSIDVLPERTRKAMLIGLGNNTVIAGAFSAGGGACPMLVAHREGGRTSACSFPQAWDVFCGVAGRQIVRPATQGEMQILRREIEASLDTAPVNELGGAIAEHKAAMQARLAEEAAAARAAIVEPEPEPTRRRLRITGGERIDFAEVIGEHMSAARTRRSREAESTGLNWLFEETLVLPEDFGDGAQADTGFDFDAAETELLR
ncbi:MAG: hypothetical protein ACRDMZ_12310, partial [Solirubrobacteraceae bacterium]